jgi:hypothetical protein
VEKVIRGLFRAPPAVLTDKNNIDVYVRWSDGSIYHQWFGTSWNPSMTSYEWMYNTVWSVVY